MTGACSSPTDESPNKEPVAVWGGVFHLLLRHEPNPAGPVTVCGLQLRDLMGHDEALSHGLKLCRWCGEDRG